jgi:hypothetical protein
MLVVFAVFAFEDGILSVSRFACECVCMCVRLCVLLCVIVCVFVTESEQACVR